MTGDRDEGEERGDEEGKREWRNKGLSTACEGEVVILVRIGRKRWR